MLERLNAFSTLSHIHRRKEIENYLLEPRAIERALKQRVSDYNKRNDASIDCADSIEDILMNLTDSLKSKLSAQYIAKGSEYEKTKHKGFDAATINEMLIERFEAIWGTLQGRIIIIPGKEILARINQYFQENYKVSLTPKMIINEMRPAEISADIADLIERLDSYSKQAVS